LHAIRLKLRFFLLLFLSFLRCCRSWRKPPRPYHSWSRYDHRAWHWFEHHCRSIRWTWLFCLRKYLLFNEYTCYATIDFVFVKQSVCHSWLKNFLLILLNISSLRLLNWLHNLYWQNDFFFWHFNCLYLLLG
jgi:hypothetical protein